MPSLSLLQHMAPKGMAGGGQVEASMGWECIKIHYWEDIIYKVSHYPGDYSQASVNGHLPPY
jgi:hypothetical protein